ncbi:hypothetical protein OFQ49_00230 [Brachyspira hyodysenteriae]|nr:hypothetical protein [Brachyspira hyodysenteriae]MCZ9937721.1 hypothetical protein [Brachyspira hyodysenteriae]
MILYLKVAAIIITDEIDIIGVITLETLIDNFVLIILLYNKYEK